MSQTPPSSSAPVPDDLAPFLVSGEAGTVIFEAGEAASHVYFVQRGRIEVTTARGGASRTDTLGMGDFFGESALLDDQPRTQTARAITSFTLVKLDRATFRQVAASHPEIPLRMLLALIGRERERPLAVAVSPGRAQAASSMAQPEAKAPRPIERAVLTHAPSGRRFTVTAPAPATLGRIDRQTGYTPEVDLTDLDVDRTLSRRHAVLTWRDGACFVREDKATRNGTFVNGTRLDTGVDTRLQDGDRLRCGLVELVFHAE